MQTSNSIVQELHDPDWEAKNIRVFFKRDDLIHPLVSGNKWRKLKYHLELCAARKNTGILTFGGAYSNHLLACAAVCQEKGLSAVGIVRGDELNPNSNPTLRDCAELGMHLRFVARDEYELRHDRMYQEEWLAEFPNHLLVEEGGAGYYGMIGCQEIVGEIEVHFDQVWLAMGTGTTSCGVLLGLQEKQTLHAVPVLKGFDALATMTTMFGKTGLEKEWIHDQLKKAQVHPEFHFGGYGKYTEELLTFVRSFYFKHHIPLDPVYTGKAVFALCDELKKSSCTNTSVLFIHTGGIQGARGIEEKTGFPLFA